MNNWRMSSTAAFVALAVSSCMVSPDSDSEGENIGTDVAALCGLHTEPVDGCGCPPHEPPPPPPPVCVDLDADGICDIDDLCLGTIYPEAVPLRGLAVNHFALIDDPEVFTTVPPRGGPERIFTIYDTGGCNCEQILDALGGRVGQYRNGCSYGTMLNWVRDVNGGHPHGHPHGHP